VSGSIWYFAKSAGTSTRHDDAEAVEQAGAKTGVRVIAVRAEVGDADDLRAIVAKAAQAFGGLVPCWSTTPSIEKRAPFLEISLDQWS